jgi:diguanylate cyclase (GGDEF)-like protein
VGDVARDGSDTIVLRRELLERLSIAQRRLLGARKLSMLVAYLLEELPLALGQARGELHLHDPDGELTRLLGIHGLFGAFLVVSADSEDLFRLYGEEPRASLLSFGDERMFRILVGADDVHGAVMMPLFDGNRLLASYHVGLSEASRPLAGNDLPLFMLLAQLIAGALLRVVEREKTEQLTLVDPITEVGNQRAFRRDMQREIAWARRVKQPLSLLYISLDDLDPLCGEYGEVVCNFLQRRVAQRLCSRLRATDYMAHVGASHFAVLLPGCSELHAHDIAERMRLDIERLAIDDGRGAVLHVTLSVGLVCWEPAHHHVASNERLATQLESEARGAMLRADRGGGNRVSVARLGLLMV